MAIAYLFDMVSKIVPAKPSRLVVAFFLLIMLVANVDGYAADKPTIYFGINLRYHPILVYKRFQPLMDYLTEQTSYRFELKLSSNYSENVRWLKEGKTQIASLGDGAFMEAVLLYGAVPILKPLNEDGTPFYRAAIVASPGAGIRSLGDLKGKRIAFGSSHSTTGNLLPRYILHDKGTTIRDLGAAVNLGNHDAVSKAVLKGEYDAGAVKDIFARRYAQYGLRVLAYSPPVPTVPIVVRKGTPQKVVDSVVEALLKLDRRNPEHKKLMDDWDEEYRYGFARASTSDYREISRLFRAIPLGCGKGCHR